MVVASFTVQRVVRLLTEHVSEELGKCAMVARVAVDISEAGLTACLAIIHRGLPAAPVARSVVVLLG
jgi:hypothetical protein